MPVFTKKNLIDNAGAIDLSALLSDEGAGFAVGNGPGHMTQADDKGRIFASAADEYLVASVLQDGDAPIMADPITYAALTGSGTISLTTLGAASTQNFDSLSNVAGSTTNATIPNGWYFIESGGGARDNGQYAVDTGSSNTGDTYSYGAAGSTDRALGQLRSGTLQSVMGAQFTNNTGAAVGSLSISYVGEQWRLSTTGRADRIDFQISFDATSLSDGTWTDIDALDFSSPDTGTVGAKNGNGAANRTALSTTYTLASALANGATFWIRWVDIDASGADDGLAIDDFSITPNAAVAGPPTLSINDVTQSEGNAGTTIFTFTVSLSAPAPAGGVTFDIATADGTASSSSDYVARALTSQTIPAGSSTYTFDVTVNGDADNEANENFFVNITNVVGATVADGQGQGTITNDDSPPVGTLSINDVTVAEGNAGTTNFTFTVTRSGGSSGAVGATWTLANGTSSNSDFTTFPQTGTVSFADGETTKTITITVAGDTVAEGNETFFVNLTAPTGGVTIADAQGLGTITNDDAAPFANVWINEINYDPVGTDANEFIEIAGAAGTDLTGWSLVLYNGNGGASYATLNLSGSLADQTSGFGFLKTLAAGLQNGAPDGIALVDNFGRVIQFLSYEGVMTAVGGPANGLTSTDIGVGQDNAALGFTLQLQGAGSSYGDFTWAADIANTEGAVNGGQSFLSANDPGQIRVLDTSIAEGNSGTTLMTFIVRRAGGGAFASDVTYTINLDGTADAADLAPGAVMSGTVSFAVGETQKTITLAIQGDTAGELNETLSVSLNSATNATIVDNRAVGTIVNDDPVSLAIYRIQGKGHISAYVGQNVTTTGIVTAVDTDGFYVQDPTGDGRVATSDAIFVATGTAPTVAVGDSISVTGIVAEVRPGGNAANLTITQITVPAVTVLSSGNSLPAAVLIGVGGRMVPTDTFDDDGFTTPDFDEASDFYESLEGMRVTIDAPLVVSPTNSFGETFVVASGGVGATGLNSRNGMTISGNANGFDDYNPERIQLDDDSGLFAGFNPNYTQGDRLSNVTGIMSYNFQSYELLVTEAVTVTFDAGPLTDEVTNLQGGADHLTIAAYNVENLDPGDGKFGLLATDIVVNLRAPDIISLEEIQDGDGAGSGSNLSGYVTAQGLIDAIAAIGGPNYVYIEVTPSVANSTGGEPGGNIRNGFLYRADRVSYVAGSAVAVPGTAFNGSRYPLAAQFTFNGETITTISVHSTSRGGSDPLFGSTQPPANAGEAARIAQSTAIHAYVTNLLSTNPDAYVAVMGDFNAFWFEDSLELLEGSIMTNLHRTLPEAERYSYVFEGNAQAIDHILVTNNLLAGAEFDAVHLNSEQPASPTRPTDHDPMLARLLMNSSAVAQAGTASGDEDTQIAGTLTAVDRNGDTLTYSIVDQPTNGTVTLGANGAYIYTPNANFNGTDTFTFRANDGFTNGPTATVTVTVNPVNDAPTNIVLVGDSVAENSANGTVVGTAAVTDPDGETTFTYVLSNNAGGRFAIDSSTGVITVANGGLLDYETATSYNIAVRVYDSAGATFKKLLTIFVTDVAEGGAALPDAASVSDAASIFDVGSAANDDDSFDAVSGSAFGGMDWQPAFSNGFLTVRLVDDFGGTGVKLASINPVEFVP